jgi:hypothetical protein
LSNIYYDPEAYGLTPIAEIDYSSGSYEFDIRVVWKDRSGVLWTARDSGCSCPTPFEDHNLSTIDRVDTSALREEIHAQLSEDYGVYITPEEAHSFLRIVQVNHQTRIMRPPIIRRPK